MIAANNITRKLLGSASELGVQEFAKQQSFESIERYCRRMTKHYEPYGGWVDYDGQIIRCVVPNLESIRKRINDVEQWVFQIDPLQGGFSSKIEHQRDGNILWWHNIKGAHERYNQMKKNLMSVVSESDKKQLEFVPLVIGGDWEFNAGACPVQQKGSFIMLNSGFVNFNIFVVMYFEMIIELGSSIKSKKSDGIITSSMIDLAAQILGYEAHQGVNIALPPSEFDRIWDKVLKPSDNILQATAFIEAFVIIHECGHILKGHTQVLSEWLAEDTPSPEEELERLNQMQEFEFEADKYACQSLLSLFPGGIGLLIPLQILFLMLRLCENNTRSTLVSTHPSAERRLYNCLEVLGQDGKEGCYFLKKWVKFVVKTTSNRIIQQTTINKKKPD